MDDVEACMDVGSVAYILGPPGCGKTAAISALAKKRGGFFAAIVGSISDPTDISGFPVVTQAEHSDSAGRKTPSLKFAPRDLLVRLNDEGGVLFLDELTSCPPATQASLLTGICDWRFGDFQLDRHRVAIVAAGNPADIAANGQELADPMNNRLEHFEFPVDSSAIYEWCSQFPGYWGDPPKVGFISRHGERFISPEYLLRARSAVAGYIRKNTKAWLDERFDKNSSSKDSSKDRVSPAWPSPRSWGRVANHLAKALDQKKSPLSAMRRITAAIGHAQAVQFQTYLREVDLPDPEMLLANPDKYKPTGRLDIDFATTMSVIAALESNVTGDRYVASWKICRTAVEDKGEAGPAYEAGMAAAIRLSKFLKRQTVEGKKLYESGSDLNKVILDSHKLSKPFLKLIKEAAGELS